MKFMRKRKLKRRIKLRKTAAVTLAAACTTGITLRNAAQTSSPPQILKPGEMQENQSTEILRLQGGELVRGKPAHFRNRFSISYRPGFNISAEFRNIGFPPSSLPGPGGGNVDRVYDDGYVRLETTGMAAGSPDGYTSYWSYDGADQVVGNNLFMHKATSAGVIASSGNIDDGPVQGMEFVYAYEIGPIGRFAWGLEGSFGFGGVNIRDSRSLMANVNVITDTFDISNLEAGGGPPPPPGTPSTGRSGTSAIILVDPASRSNTIYGGSTINGYRSIDANVYDFRVGPYVDFDLSPRISLTLSGGLSLAMIDSSFSFQETLGLPGGAVLTNSGSANKSDMLIGGYAAASVSYSVADAWRLFFGAQYRNLGSFDQSVNGAQVHLDFANALYAAVGVGYSF